MILIVIELLAVVSSFFILLQFFLYATNRTSAVERKAYSMPLGILLFSLSIAGFASRNLFLVLLSVILVALSLWLGPTTWRGKQDAEPVPLPVVDESETLGESKGGGELDTTSINE